MDNKPIVFSDSPQEHQGLPHHALLVFQGAGLALLLFLIAGLWYLLGFKPAFIAILTCGILGTGAWIVSKGHTRYLHHQEKMHHHEDSEHRRNTVTRALSIGCSVQIKYTDGSEMNIIHPEAAWAANVSKIGTQHNTYNNTQPQQLLPAGQIHIPTFAESLARGEIGPGQRKVLLCYELGRDEEEDQLTGEVEAYQDELENASTLFLGGSSKSGKSTLITHIAAQMALMGAMFYIIDPHLMHPEKSIAKRLEPLSHAFILPPAMSDADVYSVLQHAKQEAWARENGKETRLSDIPLIFIVDETLNLFGRAQRSTTQEVQQLYRDLALFMRDLGTQYNKFEMNGIFASQYVTKDAFKLPGGGVDFRDGCQSQGLLRLPPNQAQAMRLLPSSDLRGMRTLPVGHGYMGFSSGDVIRMAFGNVTVADIEQVRRMIPHATTAAGTRQYSTHSVPVGTRSNPMVQDRTESTEYPENVSPFPPRTIDESCTVESDLYQPIERVQNSTVPVQYSVKSKQFTPEQELQFVKLYAQKQDIKACLQSMHLGVGTYHACASQVVKHRKLRRS